MSSIADGRRSSWTTFAASVLLVCQVGSASVASAQTVPTTGGGSTPTLGSTDGVRELEESIILGPQRNSGLSSTAIASASDGTGFSYILSQSADAKGSVTTSIFKVAVADLAVLWAKDIGGEGTAHDICVGASPATSATSAFIGKAQPPTPS
jgi:hypothetical protein